MGRGAYLALDLRNVVGPLFPLSSRLSLSVVPRCLPVCRPVCLLVRGNVNAAPTLPQWW